MAEPTAYGPLSIEDVEQHDDGGDDGVRRHQPPSLSICRCRRRHLYVISLFIAFVLVSALLVLREAFHLSFSNLLRTIFGGSKYGSSNVAVCDGNQDTMGGETIDLNRTTVESLDLDRIALAFNEKSLTDVDEILSSGFWWNQDDAGTTKWRPQGVTTFHASSGRRFVLVSWYGRKDEGYSERGGRISFVEISDIQNSSQYLYCNVLLVDRTYCTLPGIHLGGIEQQNGSLYVADSRKGMQSILEFDLENGIYEMFSAESMFGYRYVLRQKSSFPSPTKPSFMAYDNDANKFVVGTYARCGPKVGVHADSEQCLNQPKNNLIWFTKGDVVSNNTVSCWHYFSEMQGAVSAKVDNATIVWVSSSYGPIADSHLHVVHAMPSFTGECPVIDDIVLDEVPIFRFPPGLEDLHIEQTEGKRFMWTVTEFGTRMVFATALEKLLG